MMQPRNSSRSRSGKRKRGDPKVTRIVTRVDPIEPTLPRVHRARVAIILLKAAVKRRDWRKVSTGIWLLESLKSDAVRYIDRYAEIESHLGRELDHDEAEKFHLDEKLRTKNDT